MPEDDMLEMVNIKLCLHQSTGTKMSKLSNRTLPTCILPKTFQQGWGSGISKHLNPWIILQCWHEGISSLNLIIQEEMSVLHSVCYRFHHWSALAALLVYYLHVAGPKACRKSRVETCIGLFQILVANSASFSCQ